MKYFTLLICIFPLVAWSQAPATAPACKLIKETDPYTKETRFSSGFIPLQGGSLTIDADSKELDFFFVVPDKCFASDATVVIYFEGSRNKISYRNTGSMNCDGNFHFIFRNGAATPSVLQKLATQKVSSFVFTGSDKKAVTVSLLPDQQTSFQQITSCMVTESKALIK
jgi:hypothetical protein